ncbi:MAG: type VI secretion system ATPase TssH, partial [Spirochaetaceae bacterium]|nr:type VI secretion system ATPase TssH [Spirochaetaceae bacterium]
MNYEQYTIKAQEALRSATILAQQEDHSEVGTAHILSAILEQADGIIPPLFERIGVPIKRIQAEAKELVSQTPKMHGNVQISISPEAAKVLAKAEKEAAQLKDEYLAVE